MIETRDKDFFMSNFIWKNDVLLLKCVISIDIGVKKNMMNNIVKIVISKALFQKINARVSDR